MVRGMHEARDLIVRGGVDVVQPDVVLSGGIGGGRRIADLADLWGGPSPRTRGRTDWG
jgi:L-alanine-DL-glutamate epimerase-like enolase superfamily enzyme